MFWSRPKLERNGPNLIRLPLEDSKESCLRGFWEWVGLMADADYSRAVEALYWKKKPLFTAKKLEERITNFWGGGKPWSVVVPNERLIRVVEDAADYSPSDDTQPAWFMAQIPVTTEPNRAKDDDIPLQGVAVSFLVRNHEGSKVLDFEIFHF